MKKALLISLYLLFSLNLKAENCLFFSDIKKGFGLAEKGNAKIFLLGSAAVAGAFLVDEEIRNIFKRNQREYLSSLAELGNFFGDGKSALPVLGGISLLGLTRKDRRLFTTSLEAIEAFLVSGIVTSGIKVIVMRKRPYKEEGKFAFGWGNKSFPSGHTTVAFALFTVFARRYKIPQIYIFPALTAFARVYKDAHWLSDVVAGAIIGYVVGRSIVKLHEKSGLKFTGFAINKKSFRIIFYF